MEGATGKRHVAVLSVVGFDDGGVVLVIVREQDVENFDHLLLCVLMLSQVVERQDGQGDVGFSLAVRIRWLFVHGVRFCRGEGEALVGSEADEDGFQRRDGAGGGGNECRALSVQTVERTRVCEEGVAGEWVAHECEACKLLALIGGGAGDVGIGGLHCAGKREVFLHVAGVEVASAAL